MDSGQTSVRPDCSFTSQLLATSASSCGDAQLEVGKIPVAPTNMNLILRVRVWERTQTLSILAQPARSILEARGKLSSEEGSRCLLALGDACVELDDFEEAGEIRPNLSAFFWKRGAGGGGVGRASEGIDGGVGFRRP